MRFKVPLFLCLLGLAAAAVAADTELVRMAQQDLTTLGYDPGGIDGQAGTKTIIAVSKFQAERGMEVTGEVTPQLIGALRAAINQPDQPAAAQAPATVAAAPALTPAQQQMDLQARQQACLQEKYAAAQEANKRKRGFGRLLSAASRVSGRFGGGIAGDIQRTTYEVYNANATAADISAAAKDLGLTEDDVEQCRNPS